MAGPFVVALGPHAPGGRRDEGAARVGQARPGADPGPAPRRRRRRAGRRARPRGHSTRRRGHEGQHRAAAGERPIGSSDGSSGAPSSPSRRARAHDRPAVVGVVFRRFPRPARVPQREPVGLGRHRRAGRGPGRAGPRARRAGPPETRQQEQAASRRRRTRGSRTRSPGSTTSSADSPRSTSRAEATQVRATRTADPGVPQAGPNSFADSFGWPRVGHTHQGIDLISPAGTPVGRPTPGPSSRQPSSSGGSRRTFEVPSGTYTFYAHLSGTAASGERRAGTVIGYVGSTGNAGSTNHLHFEYHPAAAPRSTCTRCSSRFVEARHVRDTIRLGDPLGPEGARERSGQPHRPHPPARVRRGGAGPPARRAAPAPTSASAEREYLSFLRRLLQGRAEILRAS